ncbi:katanin p60 ATPase-containing subunit A-like 2 [Dysidea avara]|uniref:katanin p60 ATPase-containing subunit A-like 2 n=1 Tax=Dysidea avara TaxID=196820 RepID=UPI00332825F8
MELNYIQLKTANEARIAEETKVEQRRKNILVLILHYLTEEGFLDTAQTFEKEVGSNINKYVVCDNIDLVTVLQEYESYYFVKFHKYPRITKRITSSAEDVKTSSHRSKKGGTSGSVSLPHISNVPSIVKKEDTRPLSDTRKKKRKEGRVDSKETNGNQTAPTNSNMDMELSGTTAAIKSKPQNSKAAVADVRVTLKERDATSDSEVRLLKPIAGFAGYNSEMRELAAVISRDIYMHNPDVRWSDIIGLDAAKRLVKEAVVYPIMYPRLFTGILSPWKGLLLYGPPGTGKTLLAKAVATECKTTFFNISASSIVSKWRGDSEKLVRVLFELARFHAPSTIFMDELESIMGQRGGAGGNSGGEHEGSRRMKTELLVQMDGLAKSSDLVFVLAASNLPWELDHAMLRRLEKRILVDLPSQSARLAMFRHHLPPVISQSAFPITTDIDYEKVAMATEGYSGSDIKLVCKEAVMRPVRKIFNKLENFQGVQLEEAGITIEPVTTEDVNSALVHTKPSARQLTHKYIQWQKEYESV